jgi:hypothetical protein
MVERQIRVFGAGFQRPAFSNWLRTRTAELKRLKQPFTVLVIWGGLAFTAAGAPPGFAATRLPRGEPIFAIRRSDGTIERPPWATSTE